MIEVVNVFVVLYGCVRKNDTTQLNKEITKETTDISQLSQSSQHPRQGPTKLQKDLNRRRTRHRPEHHMC